MVFYGNTFRMDQSALQFAEPLHVSFDQCFVMQLFLDWISQYIALPISFCNVSIDQRVKPRITGTKAPQTNSNSLPFSVSTKNSWISWDFLQFWALSHALKIIWEACGRYNNKYIYTWNTYRKINQSISPMIQIFLKRLMKSCWLLSFGDVIFGVVHFCMMWCDVLLFILIISCHILLLSLLAFLIFLAYFS